MITGIDIERINRFRLKKNHEFIKNNFTKKEIEYAYSKKNPEATLCGIFCAKEALIKTMKNQAILLKNIEVTHDKKGRPNIKLLNKKIKIRSSLSISHAGEYAIAIIISNL